MKKSIQIAVAIIVTSCFQLPLLHGQDFKKSGTLSEIVNFKLTGYSILDTITGDLNRDRYKDLIIIYKNDNEEKTSDINGHPEYRPLLLYLGQQDAPLKLVAHNEKAVLCYDCGGMMGDPYSRAVIKNGYFTIEYFGGSSWKWTRFVTFKYSEIDSNWYLHKDGGDSFHSSEPENVTTEIKTTNDFGSITFSEFDIFKE